MYVVFSCDVEAHDFLAAENIMQVLVLPCLYAYILNIYTYIHTLNIDTHMLCVFWAVQFLVCTNDAKMFLSQYTNKNNQ